MKCVPTHVPVDELVLMGKLRQPLSHPVVMALLRLWKPAASVQFTIILINIFSCTEKEKLAS